MTPSLNRRLVLEAPVRTPDGAGGFVQGWQALGTLWAQVEPRSGREVSGTDGVLSRAVCRITVRGAPVGQSNRPVPGQRFVAGDQVHVIKAVIEEGPRGQYLVCQCEMEVSP
ncbi:head-tail adaptor protein [Tropicibacter sp. S64]|uniref:head-tail adaptor protein n=1 Tax=Tropicibacter sp. S64 TaxID=3415122 RepID=UPI003C7AFE65